MLTTKKAIIMEIVDTWATKIRAIKATTTSITSTRTVLISAVTIAKDLVVTTTVTARDAVSITITTTTRIPAIQECPSRISVITAIIKIIIKIMAKRITPTVREMITFYRVSISHTFLLSSHKKDISKKSIFTVK